MDILLNIKTVLNEADTTFFSHTYLIPGSGLSKDDEDLLLDVSSSRFIYTDQLPLNSKYWSISVAVSSPNYWEEVKQNYPWTPDQLDFLGKRAGIWNHYKIKQGQQLDLLNAWVCSISLEHNSYLMGREQHLIGGAWLDDSKETVNLVWDSFSRSSIAKLKGLGWKIWSDRTDDLNYGNEYLARWLILSVRRSQKNFLRCAEICSLDSIPKTFDHEISISELDAFATTPEDLFAVVNRSDLSVFS